MSMNAYMLPYNTEATDKSEAWWKGLTDQNKCSILKRFESFTIDQLSSKGGIKTHEEETHNVVNATTDNQHYLKAHRLQ